MRSHTHIFNTSDERKRSNMTPIHFTFFPSKEQKLVTVVMISLLQQSINTKSHLLKLSNSSRSSAHCLINLFTETQHFSNERALKTAFEQAETSSRTGLSGGRPSASAFFCLTPVEEVDTCIFLNLQYHYKTCQMLYFNMLKV